MRGSQFDVIYKQERDDKRIMELLWRLNFQDNDRMTTFREIEIFFLKERPKLSKTIISNIFCLIERTISTWRIRYEWIS